MITVIAPIRRDRVLALRDAIGRDLGNPTCEPFRNAVEEGRNPFLHFASLHALEASDGKRGFLILEMSADGLQADALALLAERAGHLFEPYFREAIDWRDGEGLSGYWRNHARSVGFGLRDLPGLCFCGTPSQTVGSIRRDALLADEIGRILGEIDIAEAPLAKLAEVRRRIAADGRWGEALLPSSAPPYAPERDPTIAKTLAILLPSFVATFLWPLLLVLVPLSIWLAWPETWIWDRWPGRRPDAIGEWLVAGRQAGGVLIKALLLAIAGMIALLGAAFLAFRRQEARDFVSTRAPDLSELDQITARENAQGHVQNHMLSQTVRKPGFLRWLTIRIAFWIVAKRTALNPRAGHLGDIGTIHFARWVTIPGTRDLLFFSNYGGSWESYLEDFITKAHKGLTAVWSNTVGFPRSRALVLDGATKGEEFKRYARQSMVHTPFWYSAYPELTTANIRTNRLIARGLSAAMSEPEAVAWLSAWGSAPRPPEKLESTQIQSLVFGGMGFKPAGRLMVIDLAEAVEANREWLREMMRHVALNDGRYAVEPALISLALSARGLRRLGLDAEAVASFPAAFLQGMHSEGRARILGDLEANRSELWEWGNEGNDVAVLVYGDDDHSVGELTAKIEGVTNSARGSVAWRQDLTTVPDDIADRKEPFGFVDGVSQPAIRGTYRGLRNDDPIHLVEPGEVILGYPDNRGHVPPGPEMSAARDPELKLPVAGQRHGFAETVAENPRLVGYNGSFLVIRQLAQDAAAFRAYCGRQGEKLTQAFPDLPLLTDQQDMSDFVGAKMIGRWQDGSSLVRFPYVSATRLKALTKHEVNVGTARPQSKPTDPAAPEIAPADDRPQPKDTGGGTKQGAAAIRPDNDFLFGTEDPQGLRCPFGAHVRRANPRESLAPGSNDQIAISNRHRILRVGRGYRGSKGETAGLMFMCLNADIERQFEFVQQTWMGSTKFHGLSAEADPIVGRGLEGCDGFTVPTRRGPVGLGRLPQFVTMRGGGYFFLPGRQLLNYLATA